MAASLAAAVPLSVAASLATAAPLSAQQRDRAEAPPAPGERLPVVEHTLDNGMRLLVLARAGAPIVSFVVQFDVGSVNEAPGHTGIAHLLEHLLFKGTTTLGTSDFEAERELFPLIDAVADSIIRARAAPEGADSARLASLAGSLAALQDSARSYVVPGEFARILQRHGARGLNASTDTESTRYYVQLPANRLELWFALESARIRDPVFREFHTEREVVIEERRQRVETSGAGLLMEALLATAYRVHPYGVPVIGHMSDILDLTRAQVEDYYRRYYGPGNAVVAVVGEVDPARVIELAERYFAPIPAGEPPPPVLAVEPPQRGERRVEVHFDAEPRLSMGWHTVSELHADAPALAVLASLLAGGRTSRLHRRLVIEERIAQNVVAGLMPGAKYPRLFTISASPRAPHTTAELEAAIYDELERIAREPPTELELLRVRSHLEAADVQRLTSGFGLALQLAASATLHGDWRRTFRSTAELRRVDAGDVARVAAAYLTRDNRTVATLVRPEER